MTASSAKTSRSISTVPLVLWGMLACRHGRGTILPSGTSSSVRKLAEGARVEHPLCSGPGQLASGQVAEPIPCSGYNLQVLLASFCLRGKTWVAPCALREGQGWRNSPAPPETPQVRDKALIIPLLGSCSGRAEPG